MVHNESRDHLAGDDETDRHRHSDPGKHDDRRGDEEGTEQAADPGDGGRIFGRCESGKSFSGDKCVREDRESADHERDQCTKDGAADACGHLVVDGGLDGKHRPSDEGDDQQYINI